MTDQRVALVTGAGRGIGRAVVEAFAAQRVATVVVDLDLDAARAVALEIGAGGVRSVALRADVARPTDLADAFARVGEEFGRLDILVNNAGILSNTPFDEVEEGEWDRVMAVNVKSAMFASQQALRLMRPRGWGRIVMVSSFAGRAGGVSVGPAYAASKAALLGLTKHLARMVAAEGITVNAVAPGTIQTDIIKGFSARDLEAIRTAIPVRRLGQPQEVAETIAFLASDPAGFITGAVIDVNGGMYMA